MDGIIKLPVSNGFDCIQVFVDRFSKMVILAPYKEDGFDASDLAKMYLNHVVAHHGLQTDILSDRGTTFTSSFFTSFIKMLGVRPHFTTAFHPQGNGQTEKTNQATETYLRMFCDYHQSNWSDLLPTRGFALNNSRSATTLETPFFADHGYHPLAPSDFLLTSTSHNPAASAEILALANVHSSIHKSIIHAQELQKEYYDRKHRAPVKIDKNGEEVDLFNIGDLVWLNSRNIATSRPSFKLDARNLGPFPILRKLSPVTYVIDLPPTLQVHPVFPVSLLLSHTPGLPNQYQDPAPLIEFESQELFIVERILAHEHRPDGTYYLVHWQGYQDIDDTWEPADGLARIRVLHSYLRSHPDARPRKPRKPRKPQLGSSDARGTFAS